MNVQKIKKINSSESWLHAATASEAIVMLRSKKSKQQNKKRRNLAGLVTLVVMFVLLITCVYAMERPAVSSNAALQTVQVEDGDTLWSIAREYCSGKDIRDFIYEIKELNQLQGDRIDTGDIIYIP